MSYMPQSADFLQKQKLMVGVAVECVKAEGIHKQDFHMNVVIKKFCRISYKLN